MNRIKAKPYFLGLLAKLKTDFELSADDVESLLFEALSDVRGQMLTEIVLKESEVKDHGNESECND